eukprot:CAMPEP_0176445620 /NCGR_PEP_ID=MMETSP0127-20121128/23822_1 /TAXON_ID=938130 /ORGANISM="Platyophrya macrostoma, Strain WH" /LENGTH=98 /DNA_ID=CAMNT_0017831465 /DNA_START=46 /DNA_END=342 /DNA_ORIENTATION=-
MHIQSLKRKVPAGTFTAPLAVQTLDALRRRHDRGIDVEDDMEQLRCQAVQCGLMKVAREAAVHLARPTVDDMDGGKFLNQRDHDDVQKRLLFLDDPCD